MFCFLINSSHSHTPARLKTTRAAEQLRCKSISSLVHPTLCFFFLVFFFFFFLCKDFSSFTVFISHLFPCWSLCLWTHLESFIRSSSSSPALTSVYILFPVSFTESHQFQELQLDSLRLAFLQMQMLAKKWTFPLFRAEILDKSRWSSPLGLSCRVTNQKWRFTLQQTDRPPLARRCWPLSRVPADGGDKLTLGSLRASLRSTPPTSVTSQKACKQTHEPCHTTSIPCQWLDDENIFLTIIVLLHKYSKPPGPLPLMKGRLNKLAETKWNRWQQVGGKQWGAGDKRARSAGDD